MNYIDNFTLVGPPAAYILAGGASLRMGSDKAMLQFEGQSLLSRVVRTVSAVTNCVRVVAPSHRYQSEDVSVISDLRNDCGPLAGIEAALIDSPTPWTLILPCDMPFLNVPWLVELVSATTPSSAHLSSALLSSALLSSALLSSALLSSALCIASGPTLDNPNPLCAVWHRKALNTVQRALDSREFRVRDILKSIPTTTLVPSDPKILANWNRPEDIRALIPHEDRTA
jgi:molybdopterin-guanine dinucleotide biosynthesis protein A